MRRRMTSIVTEEDVLLMDLPFPGPSRARPD
jgi:hypothetical protein